MGYVPTLKTRLKEQISLSFAKEFGYSSVIRAQASKKTSSTRSMGQAARRQKLIEMKPELTTITGQKAVQTRSRETSQLQLRKGACLSACA